MIKASIALDLYKEGMDRWKELDPLVNTSHTMIAGTTGSGKSVLLKSLVYSIMSAPSFMLFIDLKRVELRQFEKYQGCAGYVDDPDDVHRRLLDVIQLMEERYEEMQQKEIYSYRGVPFFVVIDELADLVTDKKVLADLVKIGRLGRAAKIHLICATQDPSRKTLSAQLMQNMSCSVALRCKTAIESRQVIGIPGAEELPKYGKAIFSDADGIHKLTVPFTEDEQIRERVNALLAEGKAPSPAPSDDMFDWRGKY